jgi:hypothetical protein
LPSSLTSLRWREANPEKAREAHRRWREANPEKQREAIRRWQDANPEKGREQIRRWREANLEKARAREAAYRAANREARRAYMAAYRASQKEARRLHAREATFVPEGPGPGHRAHNECSPGTEYDELTDRGVGTVAEATWSGAAEVRRATSRLPLF